MVILRSCQGITRSGLAHTRKDNEVNLVDVKEAQKELNGHISMLIKTFKIGSNWGHGD